MPPLGHESYKTVPLETNHAHELSANETIFRLEYLAHAQMQRFPSSSSRQKIAKVYYRENESTNEGTAAWIKVDQKTGNTMLFTQRVQLRDTSKTSWQATSKPQLRLSTDGQSLRYFDFDEQHVMLEDSDQRQYLLNVGCTLDLIEQYLEG